MRARRSVLLACAVAIILTAVLIWLGKRPIKTTSPELVNTKIGAPSTRAAVAEQGERKAAPTRETPQNTSARTNSPVGAPQAESDDPRRGLAALNDVPIVFEGKVEDQFGNPVEGATIAASVRIYSGFKSGVDRFTVTSDANGFFHIDHGKGETLGLVPKKEGYVLATADTYFKYSYMYPDHFTPDLKNPTTIKMWKLQGADPLVKIDQIHKLPHTGSPIHFDLIAGNVISSGGDLSITVNRPGGIISEQHPQDWSITVEVVDGGLIEAPEREWAVSYLAPELGYQPSGVFPKNNGVGSLDKTLFIKSRSGQVYSKVSLSLSINKTPEALINLRLGGVANANSSRNWEEAQPQ